MPSTGDDGIDSEYFRAEFFLLRLHGAPPGNPNTLYSSFHFFHYSIWGYVGIMEIEWKLLYSFLHLIVAIV